MAFTWSRENRTGELFNNGTRTGIQVVKDEDQNKTIDLNPTNHPRFDIGLKRDDGTEKTLHGYLRDLMCKYHLRETPLFFSLETNCSLRLTDRGLTSLDT